MRALPLYGRQGKFTYRLLAIALFGQSVILSFFALVARGNALALVVSGMMRSPVGITLGWLVQVLTWASAVLVTAMIGVALVFTLLWVLLLVQGHRVDALVAQREQDEAAGAEAS